MKETEVPAPHFDLEMTLNSGQVFHWEKVGAGFYGTIEDRATYVEQRGATLRVATEGGAVRRDDKSGVVNSAPGSRELAPPVSELVRHYFALDHPLDEICASFPRDPAMNAARDFCRGLRIIRQPKWECLATFICSSMKQVAHIRQISRTVAAAIWGKEGNLRSRGLFISVARSVGSRRARSSCENAGWVIARKICWQRRNASPRGRQPWILGVRCLTANSANNCAICQA